MTLFGRRPAGLKTPAPNIPKLGRLQPARQGLVSKAESNTKYGGKCGFPAEWTIARKVRTAGSIGESLRIRKPNSHLIVSSSIVYRELPKSRLCYARFLRFSGGSCAVRVVFLPVIHMAVDLESKDEPVDTRTPEALIETSQAERAAALRRSRMIGYVLLVATSVGWGLNWPVTKRLLSELPPLSLRGLSGIIGAALLALLAVAFRQSLKVPSALWPRLVLLSLLNVTAWMALMGLALTFLPASEAAVMAYTMPVWASVLAWPILGERISLLRVVAMAMAIAGLVALMGGGGVSATSAKMPGILLALAGAFLFAVGTVLAKRWPLTLPPLTSAVWQILIGCIPVSLAGLLLEQPHFTALSSLGWSLFAYSIVVQFCVAYACWFAALERLPASVAAIGTLLVPVIGVVASATALGEPLGLAQIAALGFTIAGVVLASRS